MDVTSKKKENCAQPLKTAHNSLLVFVKLLSGSEGIDYIPYIVILLAP